MFGVIVLSVYHFAVRAYDTGTWRTTVYLARSRGLVLATTVSHQVVHNRRDEAGVFHNLIDRQPAVWRRSWIFPGAGKQHH